MPRPIRTVIIGINAYENAPSLQGCVNDAREIHRIVQGLSSSTLPPPLLDRAATHQGIRTAIESAARGIEDDACLLVYFAGHGTQVPALGTPGEYVEALCPRDYRRQSGKRAITGPQLKQWLSEVPETVPTWLILDSCHSGGFAYVEPVLAPLRRMGAARWLAPPSGGVAQRSVARIGMQLLRLADGQRPNVTVLAACKKDELACETVGSDKQPWGVFTLHLTESLGSDSQKEAQALRDHVALQIAAARFAQTPILDATDPARLFLE